MNCWGNQVHLPRHSWYLCLNICHRMIHCRSCGWGGILSRRRSHLYCSLQTPSWKNQARKITERNREAGPWHSEILLKAVGYIVSQPSYESTSKMRLKKVTDPKRRIGCAPIFLKSSEKRQINNVIGKSWVITKTKVVRLDTDVWNRK